MGMNEDIAELDKRIAFMNKSQDEISKLLAVEEHKIKELVTSLTEEGYDVEKLTEEEIGSLVEKLTAKFQSTKEQIDSKLVEVEKLYAKLSDLNQKG